MASNTTLNSGTGGDVVATKERTHDGDATKVQVVTLAGVSGTEGSYTFADINGDATNGLDVDCTRVIPGTSATHLGKAVDSAAGATDTGVAMLCIRDDALTTLTPADGDYVPPRVDSTGSLHVRVSAGGITGVSEDAVASGSAEGILGIVVRDDALATLTPADGDYTVQRTNARGATWVCLDSTAGQEIVGDAAHGAAVAGNPVLAGAEGRSTAPTAVDDGDVVRVLATTLGKQVVYPYALPASAWSYASPAAVTDTADDEAKAAVASTRNYVTGVQVFNGHDTVGTEVVIKDGSTVLWRGWAEQTGGGCSARFDPPLRGTANTAINVANVTNSSSTYFNLQGFVATE